ncbi:cysteinyl-tRNA synthetase [Coemansia sp. RSA 2050]|nr:cysteinyl-tRNA synthetase [Coemansia sp. RSA 2050]KAJ2728420.1 cysteinyl-tRNA synthetase [Coemansia sp. BCRC 34962]
MTFASNNTSPWTQPESSHPQTGLRVFNSLTWSTVPFVPREGNYVSWYACGPTVYDAAHIGHARNYVTFDTIRRIMEDYFNYDVNLVMNVTDIDDKIIVRARHKHLVGEYKSQIASLDAKTLQDVETAFYNFVSAKLGEAITNDAGWRLYVDKVGDGKNAEMVAADEKFTTKFEAAQATFEAIVAARLSMAEGNASKEAAEALVVASEDVLAPWLDAQFAATVKDHSIFRDLAAHWEKDFFEDMDSMQVRRPNIITRVSEFVPEIIAFVQRIIDNGYAYECDGSVFFDVDAFDGKNGHFYAKLKPTAKGNQALLAEGEGVLSDDKFNRRNKYDFALWKKSKAGEPEWPSPWGVGRPGWHIECSVMASEILGEHIDLHTGGIDLNFPHHDNEVAQSEACFDNHQWVNYFMHAGHLLIEGMKMSKSLKNFITIKDALKLYSVRQLRLLFVLAPWNESLDFKMQAMPDIIKIESSFDNFFANVSALLRDYREHQYESDGKRRFLAPEMELLDALKETKALVHAALMDSFNTPAAMRALRGIIGRTNVYLQRGRANIDPQILEMAALYVTKIVRALGLGNDSSPSAIGWGASPNSAAAGSEHPVDRESVLRPVASVLSDFRDAVRELALSGGDKRALLGLCDRVRDVDLLDLGIVLDDHGDGSALIKFGDPEKLRRERAARQAEEDARQAQKEAAARATEARRQERLARGKLSPMDMFRTAEMAVLYSAWDDNGLPTKDPMGEDLPKSKLKKLAKEQSAQAKLHDEYLKSLLQA